jgi:hypothetical protein
MVIRRGGTITPVEIVRRLGQNPYRRKYQT